MRKTLRHALTWYGMLHKRLFKTVSFLLVLALIPVLSLLVTLSAAEGSALVRIAVACEDPEQPLYHTIVSRLQDDSEIIVVTPYADPAAARQAVENSRAEAAWIFEEQLEAKLNAFAAGDDETLVTIVTAQATTFESLAREKLYAVLYPEISYRLYEDNVDEALAGYAAATDEEKHTAYDTVFADESLIAFAFLNTTESRLEGARLLTAPLRGLLATVMVFAGLAATMLFLRDERDGVFAALSVRCRALVLFAGNTAALSVAAIFVTAALLVSGQYTAFLPETLAMFVFVVAAAGFCALIGALCQKMQWMGAVLPVTLIACVAFAPVFFNIRGFMGPQILVPTFYYLYAVGDLSFLLPMVLYSVVTCGMTYVLYVLTRR